MGDAAAAGGLGVRDRVTLVAEIDARVREEVLDDDGVAGCVADATAAGA